MYFCKKNILLQKNKIMYFCKKNILNIFSKYKIYMPNINIESLHELWLYYVEKKSWTQIYYLYYNLIEENYHMYLKFKIYIDINCKRDADGNILNHDFLLMNLPKKICKMLLDLFDNAQLKYNSNHKKNHIICDIDDTILKTYELPNHDYSMKNQNYKDKFYPFLPKYIDDYINNDEQSSSFVTLCTLRADYLYEYTKNNIQSRISNNHIIMADNFIFFYYTIIQIFNKNAIPFTVDWYDKFFYGGISKFNKIIRFLKMYPEYNFTFIGDTGEGDLITAAYLLLHTNIKNIFLHDIKDKNNDSYIKYNQKLFIYKFNIYLSYQKIIKSNPQDLDKIIVNIYLNNGLNIHKQIYLFDNFKESDIINIFKIIKD